MEIELLNKIKIEKEKLLQDGFKIIGVFGSYAKNTQTKDSDIDLLYDIEPIFIQKYSGFEAFSKLSEIKGQLFAVALHSPINRQNHRAAWPPASELNTAPPGFDAD